MGTKGSIGRVTGLAVLFAVMLLALTSTQAFAGTGEEIKVLPTLDPLNRTEESLSNGGKWSALGWDSSSSTHKTGKDTPTGWAPFDASPSINGAYWNPSTFKDTTGAAAAIKMATGPTN